MDQLALTYPELLWAGTEHALSIAMDAHRAMMAAGLVTTRSQRTDQEEEVPYNFQLQGNVGIVAVRGPLVNKDSPYNRYYGVTSYADVRRAMIHAAMHPEVKAVLLDIDSGGGAVNGVADAGNLIKTVDSIKPVYSFSGGTMASAAYWLGSSARQVYTSRVSTLGSIGVILTHMEYSKMFKEAGIGVTVMRAGEYKALANMMEPLSDKAKTQLQSQLNEAYLVFAEHVVEARGTTMDIFEAKMGQGREFFGSAAVDAGLADGVTTFDGLMSAIEAKLLDSSAHSPNNLTNFQKRNDMSRQALTQQQLAALMAGAPAAAQAQGAGATGAAETPAATNDAPAGAAETQAAETQAAETSAAGATTETPTESAVVTFLQTQLREKDAQLVSNGVEIQGLKTKITSMESSHAGLLKIAAQSLSNMRIALGGKAVDASAMTAEQVLAAHASAEEDFKKAFPVGGVAAASATESAGAEKKVDPNYLARVQATLPQPKK